MKRLTITEAQEKIDRAKELLRQAFDLIFNVTYNIDLVSESSDWEEAQNQLFRLKELTYKAWSYSFLNLKHPDCSAIPLKGRNNGKTSFTRSL